MNIDKVEDEKKARADNIRKQMRQQWIPKSTEQISLNSENITHEVGNLTISN